MTLRTKLLLAQLPLAASLLVVGTVSRRTVGEMGSQSQQILQHNHLSVLASQRMRDAAESLAHAAMVRVELPAAEVTRLRNVFSHELEFQEGNITEAGEREMTGRLRAAWTRFVAQTDESTLREIVTCTNEIIAVNQYAMVRKSDFARAHAGQMSGIMLGVTLAALLLGILSSVYLTNRLTRPLSVLAQAVRRLGQGDLEARARVDGKDEIAQVAGDFNTMAQRLSEYRSSSLGELLEAQQAAQSAIDSLPDPVVVLQRDGTMVNVNRAAEALFGLSLEDGQGDHDPLAAAEPLVREMVVRMRDHVAAGRGAFTPKGLEEAVAVPTRDGVRYILPRANPVLDEDGAIIGSTVLLQDVTRLRRFDELKSDLVATVAHEFKTPLTSMRMAIHLCAEGTVGPLTPKQGDLLFAARDDCERLQGIVDDLLDLSRIQAGRIELHRRDVSSAALVEEAVGAHRQMARERKVDLTVGDSTLDRPVNADPERLQLVLANLLTNAIQHTPEQGRVQLRASAADDQVRFEVSDSGAGIAPEYQSRLFERFFRAPGAQRGGAGLGLYICKEIVEAHGGQIGVDSAPGRGSTFWFTLPLSTTRYEA